MVQVRTTEHELNSQAGRYEPMVSTVTTCEDSGLGEAVPAAMLPTWHDCFCKPLFSRPPEKISTTTTKHGARIKPHDRVAG